MDYFYRLFGLSDIETIRKNQIERQRIIDKNVEQYLNKCPETIARYYQYHRELSRGQQMRFIETSLTEKLGLLNEELKQNELYYDVVEKALLSPCFCQKLREINGENVESQPAPVPIPISVKERPVRRFQHLRTKWGYGNKFRSGTL